MSSKNTKPQSVVRSPPKFIPLANEEDIDNISQKMTVSPGGRMRKSTSISIRSDLNFNEVNSDTLNLGCDKCDKCVLFRDNINKAVNHIRSYIDNINERLNLTYHKTAQLKKSNAEVETALTAEYYHTIYYSELDKFKLGSEMVNQFRFLMKSLRFFNDKFEYIVRKHENFEQMANEYKNFKISNKIEEMGQLTDSEINEVKSLNEHSIFKNFNSARENFENCLKDLKSSMNVNSTNIAESKLLDTFEINLDNKNLDSGSKETYLKNELTRMVKENTSLRLELNYIYEKLREENKIYEIKEDIIIKKCSSSKDNIGINGNIDNSNINNSGKYKKSKSNGYNSAASSSASNNYNNSLVVFKVKNERKDEDYWIAKNYIKMLKQSEFYMI